MVSKGAAVMGVESAQTTSSAAASTAEQAQDLIDAARYDDLKDVVVLFSAGVSLDFVDSQGRTALHMAAANGHLVVVEYLIQNGVSHLMLESISELQKKSLLGLD